MNVAEKVIRGIQRLLRETGLTVKFSEMQITLNKVAFKSSRSSIAINI